MFIHKVNVKTGEFENLEMDESDFLWAKKNEEESDKLKETAEAEAAVKAAQKAELLAKLGITEEDAKLLLS
jgi:transposase